MPATGSMLIAPAGARKGMLVMEWGTIRWSAPIVVM
jgi:hypothetical protein